MDCEAPLPPQKKRPPYNKEGACEMGNKTLPYDIAGEQSSPLQQQPTNKPKT
jgi:hypothetical protein